MPVRKLTDIDLISELNVEKFELAKTGHIKFSHPENTHDDVFWAVALAVYAAVKYAPITVARGKRILWAFGKALKSVWGWSRKRL